MLRPQLYWPGQPKNWASCLVLVWAPLEPEALGSSRPWGLGKPFLPLSQRSFRSNSSGACDRKAPRKCGASAAQPGTSTHQRCQGSLSTGFVCAGCSLSPHHSPKRGRLGLQKRWCHLVEAMPCVFLGEGCWIQI